MCAMAFSQCSVRLRRSLARPVFLRLGLSLLLAQAACTPERTAPGPQEDQQVASPSQQVTFDNVAISLPSGWDSEEIQCPWGGSLALTPPGGTPTCEGAGLLLFPTDTIALDNATEIESLYTPVYRVARDGAVHYVMPELSLGARSRLDDDDSELILASIDSLLHPDGDEPVYTVARGDTLRSIAETLFPNDPVQGEQLLEDANDLAGRPLLVGDRLIIPQAEG